MTRVGKQVELKEREKSKTGERRDQERASREREVKTKHAGGGTFVTSPLCTFAFFFCKNTDTKMEMHREQESMPRTLEHSTSTSILQ